MFFSHFLFSDIWLFGSVGDSNISIADSRLCFWWKLWSNVLSANHKFYFSRSAVLHSVLCGSLLVNHSEPFPCSCLRYAYVVHFSSQLCRFPFVSPCLSSDFGPYALPITGTLDAAVVLVSASFVMVKRKGPTYGYLSSCLHLGAFFNFYLCFWSNFGQMSLSAKSQVYFSAPLCCTPCYVGSLQLTTLSRFLVHVYASLMQYILVLSCVVFPLFHHASAPTSAPTHYRKRGPSAAVVLVSASFVMVKRKGPDDTDTSVHVYIWGAFFF